MFLEQSATHLEQSTDQNLPHCKLQEVFSPGGAAVARAALSVSTACGTQIATFKTRKQTLEVQNVSVLPTDFFN